MTFALLCAVRLLSRGVSEECHATSQHHPTRLTAAALAAVAVVAGVLIAPPAYAAEVSHTIAQVQGTRRTTPCVGQPVTVEGVVTGDHRVGGYRGHLPADRRVRRRMPRRCLGRHLRLPRRQRCRRRRHRRQGQGDAARSSEFSDVTQITASAAGSPSSVVEARASVPAPTHLPATVLGSAREPFEGMLVQPTGTYKVVSSHNLQSFGELWTSAGSGDAGRGLRDAGAGTHDGERHHDREQQRAPAPRRRLQHPGRRSAHAGDQPYFDEGRGRPKRRHRELPRRRVRAAASASATGALQPPTPVTDESAANLKPTFTATNPRRGDGARRRWRHHGRSVQRAQLLHDAHFAEPDARGARHAERVRHPEVEDRHGDQRARRRRRRAAGDRELGEARREDPTRRSPTSSPALNAAAARARGTTCARPPHCSTRRSPT